MKNLQLLKDLGFKKASTDLEGKQILFNRMNIAYEKYRYIKQDQIDAFNKKLKEETLDETGKAGYNLTEHYDQIVFIKTENYSDIPPTEVLEDMDNAKEDFDYFEIGKIEGCHEYKDPIAFGRIKGCPDRFYIAQWGDDVKIEDIITENEG
jgi:hypothetical protein